MAAGDGDEREESERVSDGLGGDEDAEGGAELSGAAVGVDEREPRRTEGPEEGSDAVAEGERWSKGAGSAGALNGMACDGGAIAVGSRATSRRAGAGSRESGSTLRGSGGRDSRPKSFARVSGAKLVAVEEVIEPWTGAELSPVQCRARPPRASATREITTSLRRWADSCGRDLFVACKRWARSWSSRPVTEARWVSVARPSGGNGVTGESARTR